MDESLRLLRRTGYAVQEPFLALEKARECDTEMAMGYGTMRGLLLGGMAGLVAAAIGRMLRR